MYNLFRFHYFPVLYFLVAHDSGRAAKARTVFTRSNTGVIGSNCTRGMDIRVRLFCVFVVLRVGSGLAITYYPVQVVLPTVYKIKELNKRPRPNEGL
jgi:hypothetical protein